MLLPLQGMLTELGGFFGSTAVHMVSAAPVTCICRRKKDHGRAEAMLIAAWGVGLRLNTLAPDASQEDNSCSAALEAEALQDDVSF